MSPFHLTDGQFDALRELSNIGMGHAANALSQLLGETIFIRVPRVTVAELSQVPEYLGGQEKMVAGVTLQVLGDARGTVLMVFPQESVQTLLGQMLRRCPSGDFNEIEMSTLKEVGNILASAYLSALGNLLHMTLIPSIPLLAHDMVGAIVDSVLIELSKTGDQAIMLEAEFYDRAGAGANVTGHFFLLPDRESVSLLLDAIGAGER